MVPDGRAPGRLRQVPWVRVMGLLAAGAVLITLAAVGFGRVAGGPGGSRDPHAAMSTAGSGIRPVGGARRGCARAHGPFRVMGTVVLGARGKPYIPYGITLSGLEHPDYPKATRHDVAKIKAIAAGWCGNTVRLQLGQTSLVGHSGTGDSHRFLAAVSREVHLAERLHLVVVLNDQTEEETNQLSPTPATAVFWKDLARVYGHDPQVIFDLFNEPRLHTGNPARDWRIWQRGGWIHGRQYLGMQHLVHDVRADDAANLLWIEGPHWAGTLARVGSHRITGPRLVYAIHHPTGAHTPRVWTHDFGYLITDRIAPVVDGEWANYAADRAECWANAPSAAPRFLHYLHRHGIGVTAWALRPGVLIESSRLTDPTHIHRNWSCHHRLNQGIGSLLREWYRQHNTTLRRGAPFTHAAVRPDRPKRPQ